MIPSFQIKCLKSIAWKLEVLNKKIQVWEPEVMNLADLQVFRIWESLFSEEAAEDTSEDRGQALLLAVSAIVFSSRNNKFTFQICICHFSSTAEKKIIHVFAESCE